MKLDVYHITEGPIVSFQSYYETKHWRLPCRWFGERRWRIHVYQFCVRWKRTRRCLFMEQRRRSLLNWMLWPSWWFLLQNERPFDLCWMEGFSARRSRLLCSYKAIGVEYAGATGPVAPAGLGLVHFLPRWFRLDPAFGFAIESRLLIKCWLTSLSDSEGRKVHLKLKKKILSKLELIIKNHITLFCCHTLVMMKMLFIQKEIFLKLCIYVKHNFVFM